MAQPHNTAYRTNLLWIAAFIHRISGLLLALFLPLHFLVLGLAIEGEAHLDTVLVWTENPLVKLAEMGLIFLLTVHLLGGLRVLLIENRTWRSNHKTFAALAAAIAAVLALIFLARAL